MRAVSNDICAVKRGIGASSLTACIHNLDEQSRALKTCCMSILRKSCVDSNVNGLSPAFRVQSRQVRRTGYVGMSTDSTKNSHRRKISCALLSDILQMTVGSPKKSKM